jgi:hypothetical protein
MRQINGKLGVLLIGIALFGVGCSNSSTSSNNSPLDPINGLSGIQSNGSSSTTTPTTTPNGSVVVTNSATFVPVSLTEFNSYVATHPLNNPTDFKITMDLVNVASTGLYSGTVQLSYNDTGYKHAGVFVSGAGLNASISGLKDNSVYEAIYNRWYTVGSQTIFSGVFQDAYGAIVVVIDSPVSQGDAQGGASAALTGTVYYKNFAQSYAQQSPYRKCWFIYSGPFSCRTTAMTNSAYVASVDGGFRKLGTFSGLSKAQSFQ